MATVLVNPPSLAECKKAIRSTKYKIGAGVDRAVYRLPDSPWVYKVAEYEVSDNEREYQRYLDHKDSLPDGIAFPIMVLLSNGVLAAEYIENEVEQIADSSSECDFGWHYCLDESKCWATPWITKIEAANIITDIHGGNIRLYNGLIYLIDLA